MKRPTIKGRPVKILIPVILGVIGTLGVLRGLEILVMTHAIGGVIFPLALGLLFIALFLREWKKNRATSSASR